METVTGYVDHIVFRNQENALRGEKQVANTGPVLLYIIEI